MKKNFQVIEISVRDGKARVIASNLNETRAWERSMALEEKQTRQGAARSYWYAVTDAGDWRHMAAAYYNMRRQNQFDDSILI